MYNIYVLKCPITNDVRYVGQTRMKLEKRLSGHLYDALSRDKVRSNHKDNWIKKLIKDGHRPIIESVEFFLNEIGLGFILEREKFWISNYKIKYNLLNSTDGGEYSLNNKIIISDMSGDKNPMFGKKHNNISKKIMSDKKKGLYDGLKNPRSKPIYQYDKDLNLIKKWDYAKECCEFLNISRGNVSVCAKYNSEIKSDFMVRYGFIFSFVSLI
jgi:group I intron endonuclease